MSDHQLRFKGPGFDFDAKGWVAILAAIVIVGIIVLVVKLLCDAAFLIRRHAAVVISLHAANDLRHR